MHKWEIVPDVYRSIFKIENNERDTDLGDVNYHKWCTIDGITQKVLIR